MLNILKKALGIGALALASLLPMKEAKTQTPTEAYEYVANSFVQPNDSTLKTGVVHFCLILKKIFLNSNLI